MRAPPILTLTRIADRQDFPLVSIWLVPVNHAAAVIRVNAHIDRPPHIAAIGNSGSFEATECLVELGFINAESEMIDRKIFVGLDEVERKAVVNIDGKERP